MVIAEPGSDGYYEELNARQKKKRSLTMLVKQRKVILTILYLFSRYSNQVLELKLHYGILRSSPPKQQPKTKF